MHDVHLHALRFRRSRHSLSRLWNRIWTRLTSDWIELRKHPERVLFLVVAGLTLVYIVVLFAGTHHRR